MAARQTTKRFWTYVYWNFSSNFDDGNHALKSWNVFLNTLYMSDVVAPRCASKVSRLHFSASRFNSRREETSLRTYVNKNNP